MSWATPHIQKLLQGETVKFRPRGGSMSGKIESGQLVTVKPIEDFSEVKEGSVVLCKVRGVQYLHLVSAIQGDRYQISNNRGRINGWCNNDSIYGIVISVED